MVGAMGESVGGDRTPRPSPKALHNQNQATRKQDGMEDDMTSCRCFQENVEPLRRTYVLMTRARTLAPSVGGQATAIYQEDVEGRCYMIQGLARRIEASLEGTMRGTVRKIKRLLHADIVREARHVGEPSTFQHCVETAGKSADARPKNNDRYTNDAWVATSRNKKRRRVMGFGLM